MCGRFGLFAELDALAEQFNFDPSIMVTEQRPFESASVPITVTAGVKWESARSNSLSGAVLIIFESPESRARNRFPCS